MGNKEEVRGFCASLGVRDRPQKISSCLPQQKKKKKHSRHRSAYIHTHTHSTTTTNSWRRRQTRRELISSPTRRGLQGEKERGREGETEEDVEELFLPMCGSQACGPLIPLTLTPLLCHSQRHVSLYLPISPSINLHLPCSSL